MSLSCLPHVHKEYIELEEPDKGGTSVETGTLPERADSFLASRRADWKGSVRSSTGSDWWPVVRLVENSLGALTLKAKFAGLCERETGKPPNLRRTEPKSSGSFAPVSVGLSLGGRDSYWEPVLAFFGEDDSALSGLSSPCRFRAKLGVPLSELFSRTASSWTEPVGSSRRLTLSGSEYSEPDISWKTWKTLSVQIRGER